MLKRTLLAASLMLAAASFAVAQEREWERPDRLSRPGKHRPEDSMFHVGIVGEAANTRWDLDDGPTDAKFEIRGNAAFLTLQYDYRVDEKLVLNVHGRLGQEDLNSNVDGEKFDNFDRDFVWEVGGGLLYKADPMGDIRWSFDFRRGDVEWEDDTFGVPLTVGWDYWTVTTSVEAVWRVSRVVSPFVGLHASYGEADYTVEGFGATDFHKKMPVGITLGTELHVKSFKASIEVDLIDTLAVSVGASWGF